MNSRDPQSRLDAPRSACSVFGTGSTTVEFLFPDSGTGQKQTRLSIPISDEDHDCLRIDAAAAGMELDQWIIHRLREILNGGNFPPPPEHE